MFKLQCLCIFTFFSPWILTKDKYYLYALNLKDFMYNLSFVPSPTETIGAQLQHKSLYIHKVNLWSHKNWLITVYCWITVYCLLLFIVEYIYCLLFVIYYLALEPQSVTLTDLRYGARYRFVITTISQELPSIGSYITDEYTNLEGEWVSNFIYR